MHGFPQYDIRNSNDIEELYNALDVLQLTKYDDRDEDQAEIMDKLGDLVCTVMAYHEKVQDESE